MEVVAMRVTSLAAGLLLVLAACGSEKKPADQASAAPADSSAVSTGSGPSGQAALTATAASHDVNMEFDGKVGKFDPSNLIIKSGDVVRFHNKTGGPHNVAFDKDSIPAGAEAVLTGAMKDVIAPLTGPMLVQPDAVYEISFAGAPAGVYHVHCTPHLAFNMRGTITVQ
jgi:plastocyanin